MNTFPLALSKKLEGEGERFAGRRSWAAKDFGMRSRVAQRPRRTGFLYLAKGRARRRATIEICL